MSTVTVEAGVCLGFGASNARRAVCHDSDIENFMSVQTPRRPKEFFSWMARQVLDASHDGHPWLVAGYPGPVSADGQLIGPMANVEAMKDEQYNLREELIAADPAVASILDQGFRLINVNDGTLAAQAVAARLGNDEYDTTGALILGTGVGAGVVEKDHSYDNVHRVDVTSPLEIGHLAIGANVTDTFETRYSGPAIQRRFGKDPSELPKHHPFWQELGVAAGQMALTLGLMNGVKLVGPTGGIGIGAAHKYRDHLERFLDAIDDYGNGTQQLLAPQVVTAPPEDAQTFELYGAEGVVRDFDTRG